MTVRIAMLYEAECRVMNIMRKQKMNKIRNENIRKLVCANEQIIQKMQDESIVLYCKIKILLFQIVQ